MNNDHQRPECVHSDGDEALFALGKVILNGERKRVVKHSVTLGKRHSMLLDVCRGLTLIPLEMEVTHVMSVTTL